MELIADDIAIHVFVPDDGSESAAIKVVHRPSHQEVVNGETVSQRNNMRTGLFELIQLINPNPDHILKPRFVLFDPVSVRLPDTVHDGEITRLAWDFVSKEWKYYVQCPQRAVTQWYFAADLERLDD
jgi:hypothetical protein